LVILVDNRIVHWLPTAYFDNPMYSKLYKAGSRKATCKVDE